MLCHIAHSSECCSAPCCNSSQMKLFQQYWNHIGLVWLCWVGDWQHFLSHLHKLIAHRIYWKCLKVYTWFPAALVVFSSSGPDCRSLTHGRCLFKSSNRCVWFIFFIFHTLWVLLIDFKENKVIKYSRSPSRSFHGSFLRPLASTVRPRQQACGSQPSSQARSFRWSCWGDTTL